MTQISTPAGPAPMRTPRRRKAGKRSAARASAWLSYAVLAGLTAFGLLPLAVMVSTSFKPSDQIFRIPATFFTDTPTLSHYVNVFTDSDMPAALSNTVAIGLLVTLITMIVGGCTGYAVARLRFAGSAPVSIGLLLGQLLPVTVLLLPLFQLVSRLGLIDTIPGVALTHVTIVLPLVTWMAASTFRGVPIELEEAAMIDGCGRLRAVVLIVIPVAAPGIVALAIFAFLQSWNEFIFASVVTRSMSSKTAPVALTDFAGQFQTDWGATMAAATVIALPITIAFLFVQRFFVRGMSAGAVKG